MSKTSNSSSSSDWHMFDHVPHINCESELDSVMINKESDDNMSLFSDSSICPYAYYSHHTLSTTITHVQVHVLETSLDHGAFQNYLKLKVLELPDGLEVISSSACSGCVSLEKVIIPHSVIEIGECAFRGCCRLEKIFFQMD